MSCAVFPFVVSGLLLGAAGGTEATSATGSTKAISTVEGKIQRSHLTSSKSEIHATLAFGYTTTVYMPLPCRSSEYGKKVVHAYVKSGERNRLVVVPRTEKIGATANVTITCEDGVAVLLLVKIGPPSKAVNVIEVLFDQEYDARVAAAVEKARSECLERDEEDDERAKAQQLSEFAAEATRRATYNDDIEYARDDFVVARVFRQMALGKYHFLTFTIQNRNDNEITIGEIDVVNETTGTSVSDLITAEREYRVPGGSKRDITVIFVPDNGAESFKLVLKEDGPREIVVEDIEF